jgi:signal transduction histidine kinase
MSFSQFILDSHEQYRQEVRLRNSWIVRLRWWYITGLGAVALATSYTTTMKTEHLREFVVSLIIGGLLINLLLWLFLLAKNLRTFSYHEVAIIQLLLDAGLAAAVVYFQGGIDSRATVLFAIPILAAGVLFIPVFAYISAILSTVMYTLALLTYQYFNPIAYEKTDILLPAIFYSSVFFLLAIIVSGYTERNKAKERENSYTELLSLLRHQLHHPIGVIAAIIEMMEHGKGYTTMDAKDKEYLRQLKYENHRIHTMITNLLQTAKLKQDNDKLQSGWGDVHIMNLLTECSSSVATGYKRIKDLDLQIPNDDIIMHGDAEQLRLAFENIIENAFKFSDNGHKVTITLVAKKVPTIEIDVADTGSGISEKQQKKLFTAFSQLETTSKESREAINNYSMGLGLYISKLIIEQHGGHLSLQSAPGEGTKVIIQLKRDMWRYYYGQK